MKNGRDFAMWFMQNGFHSTPDLKSNLRLNKLLSFAQLISLALDGKPLFDDDMYAFKNGLVIDNVRIEYKSNFNQLLNESSKQIDLTSREIEILGYTNELFGDVDADELSLLSHQYRMWQEHYKDSKNEHGYNTMKQRISIEEIKSSYEDDLNTTREMIAALNDSEYSEEFVTIGDTKFFYNPSELTLTNDIRYQLQKFPAIDRAYSIYIDTSQGLVIY